MHPILLQIGGFTLRSYGLMAAIGFLAAAWLLGKNRSYAKMSADQASAALFIAMIAGIVGARIFYVVQFFDQYRDHLWRIVRIDQGGWYFTAAFCWRSRLSGFTLTGRSSILSAFSMSAPPPLRWRMPADGSAVSSTAAATASRPDFSGASGIRRGARRRSAIPARRCIRSSSTKREGSFCSVFSISTWCGTPGVAWRCPVI